MLSFTFPILTSRNKLYYIALMFFTVGISACSEKPPSTQGGTNTNSNLTRLTLNDTGVNVYLDGTTFPFRSNAVTPAIAAPTPSLVTIAPAIDPGQDGSYGRDTDASQIDSDGRLGFQFVKLNANGDPFVDQGQDYSVVPWSCVKDKVTGLIWEVKTKTGLQAALYNYTWYDPDNTTNGGNPGEQAGTTHCGNTLAHCNTYEYINAINAKKLCGYSDWRLPLREELRSLIDYSIPAIGPLIDTRFFPNTVPTDHWTSQTAMYSYEFVKGDKAWEVHFDLGRSEAHGKNRTAVVVRLVRGPD